MTMSDEAYSQMLAYESNQRSIRSAQKDTIDYFARIFVNHLYHEHKMGYKQIGKRFNLKWTVVKKLIWGGS